MRLFKDIAKKAVYKVDALLYSLFLSSVIEKAKYRKAHISFNDVFESIYTNIVNAKDDSMLETLAKWHEEYAIKTHLYLFYKHNDKFLCSLKKRYHSQKLMGVLNG